MRSFVSVAATVSVAAFVVVACGGKFTTVDGNKNTSQLSPTDQNQLCNDEYNYLTSSFSPSDIAKISCADSYTQGGDCQTTFQNCVAQAQTVGVFPPPDCAAFAQTLAACNTTVAQYSDCIQQEVNAFKQVESKLPFCSQGDAEAAYVQAMSQVSAECLNLMQTCPLNFGGTTDSGGPLDAGTD